MINNRNSFLCICSKFVKKPTFDEDQNKNNIGMKKHLVIIFILTLIKLNCFSQANPNPCSAPNIDCQNGGVNGIIFSFEGDTLDYAAPGTSMPLWIGIGDTNTKVLDTSSTAIFALTKISGAGDMQGLPGLVNPSFFGYFNELNFTIPGIYEIQVTAGIVGFSSTFIVNVLPEINMCIESPSGECSVGNGNEIFAVPQLGVVIPVDAVWPVNVGLIDSLTGDLDSTFVGTIYVDQVSGPGQLYGTISMTGNKWFHFNDLRFSAEGIYEIIFHEEDSLKYKNAHLDVEVAIVTGIEEENSDIFAIFPNPIKNKATIQLANSSPELNLFIYDIAGKEVFQKNLSANSNIYYLEVSGLPAGIYYLSMKNASSVVATKKLLISK